MLLTLVRVANGLAFGVSAGGAVTLLETGVNAVKDGAGVAVAGAFAGVLSAGGVLRISLNREAVWVSGLLGDDADIDCEKSVAPALERLLPSSRLASSSAFLFCMAGTGEAPLLMLGCCDAGLTGACDAEILLACSR